MPLDGKGGDPEIWVADMGVGKPDTGQCDDSCPSTLSFLSFYFGSLDDTDGVHRPLCHCMLTCDIPMTRHVAQATW